MAFVHFKCKFDPAWDYPAIGKELFGGNKALIVAEKLSTISHVHFQGHTDFDQKQILEKTVTLGKTHFLCKEIPAPIRHVNRKVEDVEFRFMCKEDREPLYALGFFEGELAMLRAYQKSSYCNFNGNRMHRLELFGVQNLTCVEL